MLLINIDTNVLICGGSSFLVDISTIKEKRKGDKNLCMWLMSRNGDSSLGDKL